MNKNIVEHFLKTAQAFPDRIAIIDKHGESITYSQMVTRVQEQANYLRDKGIGPGDRVLVFVPMCIDLYVFVLSLFYNGSVAVFVDEWVNRARLELCCQLADCKGFVADWKIKLLALSSGELRKIPIWLNLKKRNSDDANFPHEFMGNENPALITFTTGSTGIPKAANRTHGFLAAQVKALLPLINNGLEIDMPMLPIVLLLNLSLGKTSVIADYKSTKPRKFLPGKVLKQMETYKVESLTASPFFLLEMAEFAIENDWKLSSLRKIISGGGPIFPQDAAKVKKAFPSTDFTIVYGSTEAEPISHHSSEDLLAKNSQEKPMAGLPVGRPDHTVSIIVIPIEDGYIDTIKPLAFNMPGELVVSGPHVLENYWNNDEAVFEHKIKTKDGIWHRTGDAGYLTENGELFLLGRCQARVEVEGNVLYPFQVEFALRCFQVGLKGTLINRNNEPVLVIEKSSLSGSLNETELRNYLGIKHIRLIYVPDFPMDKRHHTKIDYSQLTRMS